MAVYAAVLHNCCVAAVQGELAALGNVSKALNVDRDLLVSNSCMGLMMLTSNTHAVCQQRSSSSMTY
jgi:hypothetical protein